MIVRILSSLFLPDSSPNDWIASCPPVVTFATRLLTEPLKGAYVVPRPHSAYSVLPSPPHGRPFGRTEHGLLNERLLDIAKDPSFWDIDRATNVPEYLGTQPWSPG